MKRLLIIILSLLSLSVYSQDKEQTFIEKYSKLKSDSELLVQKADSLSVQFNNHVDSIKYNYSVIKHDVNQTKSSINKFINYLKQLVK